MEAWISASDCHWGVGEVVHWITHTYRSTDYLRSATDTSKHATLLLPLVLDTQATSVQGTTKHKTAQSHASSSSASSSSASSSSSGDKSSGVSRDKRRACNRVVCRQLQRVSSCNEVCMQTAALCIPCYTSMQLALPFFFSPTPAWNRVHAQRARTRCQVSASFCLFSFVTSLFILPYSCGLRLGFGVNEL